MATPVFMVDYKHHIIFGKSESNSAFKITALLSTASGPKLKEPSLTMMACAETEAAVYKHASNVLIEFSFSLNCLFIIKTTTKHPMLKLLNKLTNLKN